MPGATRFAFPVLVVACVALRAGAHQVGLSYLDLAVDGAAVAGELDIQAVELAHAVRVDANADGLLDAGDVAAGEEALASFLVGSIRVEADGVPCEGHAQGAELRAPGVLRLRATWRCASPPDALQVRSLLPDTLGPGHATALAVRGRVESRAVLQGETTSVRVDLRSPSRARMATGGAFVLHGVRHILSGYDHVLFLLSLLLLGGTLRRTAGVATAFTLAHSVTLALAATRTVTLPSRFVESAIAASIAWVALENWRLAPPSPPGAPERAGLRMRWLVAFGFGLVHGFGFAGSLAEIGIPPDHLPLALASFNIGVELGQLAVVVAAWPLLRRLARTGGYRPAGVRAVSGATFAFALYLLAIRAWPG